MLPLSDLNLFFERFQQLQILMILNHLHLRLLLEPRAVQHFAQLSIFFHMRLFQIFQSYSETFLQRLAELFLSLLLNLLARLNFLYQKLFLAEIYFFLENLY